MKQTGSWLALLLISAILVIEGIRGHMGRIVAVIFCPSLLIADEGAQVE